MKRLIAVCFAVCLLLGMCSLSSFAANFAKGSYVVLINPNAGLTADNIRSIGSNEFNIAVTVAAKSQIELLGGTKRITAENVDSVVTFRRGTTTLTFIGNLSTYYNVSGTINGNTADIRFTSKDSNSLRVYKVCEMIDTAIDTDVAAKLQAVTPTEKYSLSPASLSVSGIKFITTLSTVSTGSRLYAAGGAYDMDGIAAVDATVQYQNGSISSYMFSKQSSITGLQPGERVTLKASLLHPEDAEYYMFNGWVDGSGNVVSTSPAIMYTAAGKDVSFFASYVQVKPHLSMNTDSLKLNYKQTAQLSAFPNAVHWESSNPKAVRVDPESGAVEAVGSGKATITAYSADGATATCEITARYTFGQILILIFLFGFIWY